jgi:hypothetical protein
MKPFMCKLFLLDSYFWMGTIVVIIVWWFDLQLPMQSVPITTKVSLNPVHGISTKSTYSVLSKLFLLEFDLLSVELVM